MSILLSLAVACLSKAVADEKTATFTGRVYMRPTNTGPHPALPAASVLLSSSKGVSHRAYCQPDGTFTVYNLSKGSYIGEVVATGYMYPQFRVDVNPDYHDAVSVSLVSNRMPVDRPVIFVPLGEAKYYQERKPFNIKGLLFSPYGIMGIVAIFALVVGPSMKVDPEEMKKMQEEMKDSPLSFLVAGGGSAASAGQQPALAAAGGSGAGAVSTSRRTSGNKGGKKR